MFRLQEHQTVVISPPDLRLSATDQILQPFEAIVIGLDQRIVSLMVTDPGAVRWLPARLNDVLLISKEDERVMALRGTVRYEREHEHLRFRVDDAGFVAPWPSSRLQLTTPVTLTPREAAGETPYETFTREVAPDGVLLHETAEVPEGARVAVRLTLPHENEPVQAEGRVEPGEPREPPFVAFERIAPLDRSRIRAYVSLHLRDRLKLTQAVEGAEEHF